MLTPAISKVALMIGDERAPLVASSALSFGVVPLVLLSINDIKVFR
jgi:hypothetical protein